MMHSVHVFLLAMVVMSEGYRAIRVLRDAKGSLSRSILTEPVWISSLCYYSFELCGQIV